MLPVARNGKHNIIWDEQEEQPKWFCYLQSYLAFFSRVLVCSAGLTYARSTYIQVSHDKQHCRIVASVSTTVAVSHQKKASSVLFGRGRLDIEREEEEGQSRAGQKPASGRQAPSYPYPNHLLRQRGS